LSITGDWGGRKREERKDKSVGTGGRAGVYKQNSSLKQQGGQKRDWQWTTKKKSGGRKRANTPKDRTA